MNCSALPIIGGGSFIDVFVFFTSKACAAYQNQKLPQTSPGF
jgi:hypothetical protein